LGKNPPPPPQKKKKKQCSLLSNMFVDVDLGTFFIVLVH
jgi:hypothetical protein